MRFMKIFKSLKMLFIATLLAASLALASCGGGETTSCTVILHAGGGADGLRYLNAQETFYTYYDLGYRVFEYDLKLSSDGRLIGTHSGENLSGFYDGMDYQSFLSLRLSNGMTPVNEEWLVNMMMTHPDVTVVVDAKMDDTRGDADVLVRIEALEEIYGADFSSNIVPEVFTEEMWDILKEETTFDRYFFSHYKKWYSNPQIKDKFLGEEKIAAVCMGSSGEDYTLGYSKEILKQGKDVFIFFASDGEVLDFLSRYTVTGVYVDDPSVLTNGGIAVVKTMG